MNTPRASRMVTLALLLLALSPATAAEREAAPGELLVRLSPDAFAPGKRVVAEKTLDRLRDAYGIVALHPVVTPLVAPLVAPTGPVGGGAAAWLSGFGLDRVHVVRASDATSRKQLSALARRLEADPAFEVAHPNWIVRAGGAMPPGGTTDTHYPSQWHLDNVGQDGGTPGADANVLESWRITVGRPETVVALLDSGIDGDHREFRGRILPGGWDTANDDADPEDNHGHGTRVWGILGATSNNDFAVAGINWRAGVLPYKVLLTSGGTVAQLIAGLIRLAVSGADLANMSLIGFHDSPLLHDAIAAAHAAGVILIGCNGNDGSTTVNYPSAYPEVFATGWTDRRDERSTDSNRTPTLDIVAPGVDVSTVRHGSSEDDADPFSGCSAATPAATGVASLLLGLDPTLTFVQVRDILRATAADEVGPPGFDLPGRDDHYGWGRLDALAALQALGLASDGRIHVEQIGFRQVDPQKLEVHVLVLDDLQGVEPDVAVSGRMTTAARPPAVLHGVSGPNGVAVLEYAPAGGVPDGALSFEVLNLEAVDRRWDPEMDAVGTYRNDPLEQSVHVGGIRMHASADTLAIDVRVLDAEALPRGAVTVSARLLPPSGPDEIVIASTKWAASGVARFEYAPGEALAPGTYTFDVLQLQHPSLDYDAERNAVSSAVLDVLAPEEDADADGVPNGDDNCIGAANADQSDGDADGFGDACDVCPSRVDPAQRDTDGDGTGNRCDCAPYDASRTSLADVPGVTWTDPATLVWSGTVGADRYDLSSGLLDDLDGSDYGTCRADDVAGFGLSIPDEPAPGEGFFYLLRGDDATCGPGPIGRGPGGVGRVNANPAGCSPS